MSTSHSSALERLLALRELEDAGYAGRATLTKLIKSGELPAVLTPSGYKIRESELHRIAVPVGPVEPTADEAVES